MRPRYRLGQTQGKKGLRIKTSDKETPRAAARTRTREGGDDVSYGAAVVARHGAFDAFVVAGGGQPALHLLKCYSFAAGEDGQARLRAQ
jgi:hypothetical protein